MLASLEVAGTRPRTPRGLLGRDGIDGVLVLEGVRSVHTFGMRFDIDVAFCDRDGVVLRAITVPRWRVTRPCPPGGPGGRGGGGLDSSAWGIAIGDRVEFL